MSHAGSSPRISSESGRRTGVQHAVESVRHEPVPPWKERVCVAENRGVPRGPVGLGPYEIRNPPSFQSAKKEKAVTCPQPTPGPVLKFPFPKQQVEDQTKCEGKALSCSDKGEPWDPVFPQDCWDVYSLANYNASVGTRHPD